MKNNLMAQLIGIANQLIDIDPQCDLWTSIMEATHAELEKEIGPVVNPDAPVIMDTPVLVFVNDMIEEEPTFWFGSTEDRAVIQELCLKHDVTLGCQFSADQYEVIGPVQRLLDFCNDLRANIEKQPGFIPHSLAFFKEWVTDMKSKCEEEPTFWFGSTQDRKIIEELCLKHDVTFWKYLGPERLKNHQYEVIGSAQRLLDFCNDLRSNIERQPGFHPHSIAWFTKYLEETQDV